MVKCYCIFLLFIFFNVGFCIESDVNKVDATQYPYDAFVYAYEMYQYKPLNEARLGCAGIIIRKDLILTATNCLYYYQETAGRVSIINYIKNKAYDVNYTKIPVYNLDVHYGTNHSLRSKVEKVYEHPLHEHGMPYYDFSVLKLVEKMLLPSGYTPVKFAIGKEYYDVTNRGLLTGCTRTEDDKLIVSRHFHSVRMNIAPPASCDRESDQDSIERNHMRQKYTCDNEGRIFCARVHEGDEGMCQGSHVGSAFTVGEGEDRRLIGIVTTTNCICPNTAIITSLQGMRNWCTRNK